MKSPRYVNCERLVSCAPLNELEIFSLDELYVLSSVENFLATFNSSQDTSPYRFSLKFEFKFVNFSFKFDPSRPAP